MISDFNATNRPFILQMIIVITLIIYLEIIFTDGSNSCLLDFIKGWSSGALALTFSSLYGENLSSPRTAICGILVNLGFGYWYLMDFLSGVTIPDFPKTIYHLGEFIDVFPVRGLFNASGNFMGSFLALVLFTFYFATRPKGDNALTTHGSERFSKLEGVRKLNQEKEFQNEKSS